MSWTLKMVVTLARMWGEGASAAEIGREIGMTRNAVLGKAHRLQMPLHKTRTQARVGRRRKRIRPVAVVGSPKPKPIETPARPCKLFELKRDSCRWPHGDPCDRDFYFCGAVSMAESPYCLAHHRMAYRPPA